MRGTEPGRLRQALTRLADAQGEALEAADRVLETRMAQEGDRADSAALLEEALEDIRDILVGASEDVRDILSEGRDAG